ncbi:MAG: endonuclease/exonuclease/phosphatase family protein [Pseudomonadota bacterium]
MRIASHNVHYIVLRRETGAWSLADWERRKPALDAAFKELNADIIAFQEMESFAGRSGSDINLARDWLLEQNPGYAVGATGPWREFPPTQPIFYREDLFTQLDQGWFFFSDTPDVLYARTFNGGFAAFASWSEFEQISTGERFKVVNLHTDFSSGSNRLRSIDLVAERIRPWIAAGERVIVLGDFNALSGWETLTKLEDEGISFLPVRGATYHFNRGLNLFGAIDHIGVSEGLSGGQVHVLRKRYDGVFPSDHYPISADVFLN